MPHVKESFCSIDVQLALLETAEAGGAAAGCTTKNAQLWVMTGGIIKFHIITYT